MKNRTKIVISTLSMIISSCILLLVPIPLFSGILSSYDVIEYRDVIEYECVTSLNLNVDMGNVEIVYTDLLDYNAKIEIYMKMSGAGLAGKRCLDYFSVDEGVLTESYSNFSINCIPEIVDFGSCAINITVRAILQKNVMYNITSNIIEGNAFFQIPFGVHVQNLNVNAFHGNTLFDLSHCVLEGDISINGNSSNIEIRSENIECVKNSLWYLRNREGELSLNISQSTEIGANVTIITEMESNQAWTNVWYNDDSSEISAILTLNHWHSSFPDHCTWIGFGYSITPTNPHGYQFTSYDYPAQNNFNISLHNSSDAFCMYDPFYWFLNSVPI